MSLTLSYGAGLFRETCVLSDESLSEPLGPPLFTKNTAQTEELRAGHLRAGAGWLFNLPFLLALPTRLSAGSSMAPKGCIW